MATVVSAEKALKTVIDPQSGIFDAHLARQMQISADRKAAINTRELKEKLTKAAATLRTIYQELLPQLTKIFVEIRAANYDYEENDPMTANIGSVLLRSIISKEEPSTGFLSRGKSQVTRYTETYNEIANRVANLVSIETTTLPYENKFSTRETQVAIHHLVQQMFFGSKDQPKTEGPNIQMAQAERNLDVLSKALEAHAYNADKLNFEVSTVHPSQPTERAKRPASQKFNSEQLKHQALCIKRVIELTTSGMAQEAAELQANREIAEAALRSSSFTTTPLDEKSTVFIKRTGDETALLNAIIAFKTSRNPADFSKIMEAVGHQTIYLVIAKSMVKENPALLPAMEEAYRQKKLPKEQLENALQREIDLTKPLLAPQPALAAPASESAPLTQSHSVVDLTTSLPEAVDFPPQPPIPSAPPADNVMYAMPAFSTLEPMGFATEFGEAMH